MKRTTIIIEGKAFTYDDEIDDITYETISPITEEDARLLLQITKNLFEKCGLKFGLAYGTLLGAIRDHGLIKGDEDVDIFTDDEPLLRKSLPFLYENGLKVCRIMEHQLYSFHTVNNSFIDVYIKEKLPFSIWSLWCCKLSSTAVPKIYLNKFDKINFLGIECMCPHKPERLLRYWYGKTWRTPMRGHNYSCESPSRYFWKNTIKPRYQTFVYLARFVLCHPFISIKKILNKIAH